MSQDKIRLGRCDLFLQLIQTITYHLIIFWRLPKRTDYLCRVFSNQCKATCSAVLLLFSSL